MPASSFPSNDDQFEDQTISEVHDYGNGNYAITGDMGTLSVKKPPLVPRVGMIARYYGKGFGYPVRGFYIDGQRCWYRTVEEEEARHRVHVETEQKKRQEAFEESVEKRDLKWAALPQPYQDRKKRFMTNNGNWRRDYEEYELFVCEQAHLFATTFKTRKALEAFHQMSWDDQLKACPDLDSGHSGNTFGMAYTLALFEVDCPECINQHHGALSPLVGSKEYGDLPPEAED
jgi:hypothetical protein